jgi:hypothetical protein
LSGENIASLDEAERRIRVLNLNKQPPNLPKDSDIAAYNNPRLADVLKRLKYTKINQLRNRIAHHRAYRPSLAELDEMLDETRDIIFSLELLLRIQGDDINWYMNHP